MINRWRNVFLSLVLVLPIVVTPSVKAVQVKAEEDQSAVSQPAERIPAVSQALNLKLIGTAVVASDPEKGLAVIANSSTGSVRSYHEGDQIGNFVIGEIERETVMLESARGDRVLSMNGGSSSRSFQAQQAGEAAQEPVGSVTKAEIDRAVPEYMDMVRTIRIRPYLEAGRPGGVLVYNIDPESIFAKMGLANGDVLKAVNGVGLTTTQDAMEFYNTIREVGTVTLAVKRGEDKQELKFEIR